MKAIHNKAANEKDNPAWFPKYKQFKNKPKEAIKHLLKQKKGDALKALYRKDIGYIDIVWGENNPKTNKGFGLKHIVEKHGKEIKQLGFKVEDFIPIVVGFGEFKTSEKNDRFTLEGSFFRVVISKKGKKTFVLTAFDLRSYNEKKKSRGLNGIVDGINFTNPPMYGQTPIFKNKDKQKIDQQEKNQIKRALNASWDAKNSKYKTTTDEKHRLKKGYRYLKGGAIENMKTGQIFVDPEVKKAICFKSCKPKKVKKSAKPKPKKTAQKTIAKPKKNVVAKVKPKAEKTQDWAEFKNRKRYVSEYVNAEKRLIKLYDKQQIEGIGTKEYDALEEEILKKEKELDLQAKVGAKVLGLKDDVLSFIDLVDILLVDEEKFNDILWSDLKKSKKTAAKPKNKGLSAPETQQNIPGSFGLTGTAENKDTIAFNKQILKAKREGFENGDTFNLGKAKSVLKEYAENGNITISGKMIRKSISCRDKDHCIGWSYFINLPDKVNNPFAIFRSDTILGNLVVLVELKNHLNKPLMVAIKLDKNNKTKDIRSIYSKRTKKVYNEWYRKGLLLYGNEKSDLFRSTVGPIPTQSKKSLSNHKDKQKNNSTPKKPKKKGLTAPKITKARNMAARMSGKTAHFFNIPGETGRFLQRVEKKPIDSVAVTLDSPYGGGKTTTFWQWMNDVAAGGNRVLFISLEEHPASMLYQEKLKKYIDPKNYGNLDDVGEISSKQELSELVSQYDAIFIDSWQKLIEALGRQFKFDKDLRKKFDGKMFFVIFQRTTQGKMRGGADTAFDGDIICKINKGQDFSENYVWQDKNRYTQVPIHTIKYNISTAKTTIEEESESKAYPKKQYFKQSGCWLNT